MIRIYPTKFLDGEPMDTVRVHPAGRTIDQWMRENVKGYVESAVPPVFFRVNGFDIAPEEWFTTRITDSDDVCIGIEPKFEAAVGAIAAVAKFVVDYYAYVSLAMTVVSAAYSYSAMQGMDAPNAPKQSGGGPAGKRLALANFRGNTSRLNSVIKEIAGRYRVYPDYITSPHRYFVDGDPRTQKVDALMAVGVGEYDFETSDVYIGETKADDYSSGVSVQIYGPGEVADSADLCWENWYSAPEVGNSSGGQAGLEITKGSDIPAPSGIANFVFDGFTITRADGEPAFPDEWEAGLRVRVIQQVLIPIQFSNSANKIGGSDDASRYLSRLDLNVGDAIRIETRSNGNITGLFVRSVTPFSASTPGTASVTTGSAVPSRLDFDVTPCTFTITNGTREWEITLNREAATYQDIVDELNWRLINANCPLVATLNGSNYVVLTETDLIYSGAEFSLGDSSGQYDDVFGATPTESAGTATAGKTQAVLTLKNAAGVPWISYPYTGTEYYYMTIGWQSGEFGFLYDIDSIASDGNGAYQLTVSRLDSDLAVDSGWTPGFWPSTSSTGFASVTIDNSTTASGFIGPFLACPKNETTDEIEIDLFYPQGLLHVEKASGEWESWRVDVEIQYRDFNLGGAWSTVTKTLQVATQDQLGYTHKITIPNYCPEVRVRKTRGDSTSGQVSDTVLWYGLRSKLASPDHYDGITVLSISMIGGRKLSNTAENMVSAIVTRKLPLLIANSDGTFEYTANTATRDIVPWFIYMAKSVGYTDDDLDLEALAILDDIWTARGDYYDAVIDGNSTLKTEMVDCLQAGFAELTIKNGKISAVRDAERTTFEQMYSHQNMTEHLKRSFSAQKPDAFDGADVIYFDGTTWQKETVECRVPLIGDNGTFVEKINIGGITDNLRAWRVGMRRRMMHLFRRWMYSFETELDGMNSNLLSYIAISEDLPAYCKSARLVDYTDNSDGTSLLVFDQQLSAKNSTYNGYMVAIRKPDGVLDGPFPVVVDVNSADNELTINGALSFVPDFTATELPHAIYGPPHRYTYPALVANVSPGGDSTRVQIEAVNYDARVFAFDDLTPDGETFSLIFRAEDGGAGTFQIKSARIHLIEPDAESGDFAKVVYDTFYADYATHDPGFIYSNFLPVGTRSATGEPYNNFWTWELFNAYYDEGTQGRILINKAEFDVFTGRLKPRVIDYVDDYDSVTTFDVLSRRYWFRTSGMDALIEGQSAYVLTGLSDTSYSFNYWADRTGLNTSIIGNAYNFTSATAALLAHDPIGEMIICTELPTAAVDVLQDIWAMTFAEWRTETKINQALSAVTVGKLSNMSATIGYGTVYGKPVEENLAFCTLGISGTLVFGVVAGEFPAVDTITVYSWDIATDYEIDSIVINGVAGRQYRGFWQNANLVPNKAIGAGKVHPMPSWDETTGEMYLDVFTQDTSGNLTHAIQDDLLFTEPAFEPASSNYGALTNAISVRLT